MIVSTISLTVTEKSECALDKYGSPIPSLKLKKNLIIGLERRTLTNIENVETCITP